MEALKFLVRIQLRTRCLTPMLCILTIVYSGSALAEKPVSSDSIAGSVGVNVHLHYTDTPYSNFSLVEKLLTDLHVRHIRDGLVDTKWDEFYKRHNALGALGIHCVYVTSPRQTDALLADYPKRVHQDLKDSRRQTSTTTVAIRTGLRHCRVFFPVFSKLQRAAREATVLLSSLALL